MVVRLVFSIFGCALAFSCSDPNTYKKPAQPEGECRGARCADMSMEDVGISGQFDAGGATDAGGAADASHDRDLHEQDGGVASCESPNLECGGRCATCPTGDAIVSVDCDGTECIAVECAAGALACGQGCDICPTEGVETRGCRLDECVAMGCDDGFVLDDGRCRPWVADVVVDDAGLMTTLAVDSQGRSHAAVHDKDNDDLIYAVSDASGGNWSTQVVDSVGNVGWHPSIAVDEDEVFIAYEDTGNWRVKFARLTTSGWDREEVAVDGSDPELVLMNGRPAIIYAAEVFGELRWAVKSATGAWTDSLVAPVFTYEHDAAVGPNGEVVVAYRSSTGLWVTTYSGGTWGAPQILDATSRSVDSLRVAVAKSGTVHAVAYDGRSGGETLLHFWNSGGVWNSETLDTPRSGMGADIAVDDFDQLHVSYIHTTKNELRYAFHDGTRWEITTVASPAAGQTQIVTSGAESVRVAYGIDRVLHLR